MDWVSVASTFVEVTNMFLKVLFMLSTIFTSFSIRIPLKSSNMIILPSSLTLCKTLCFPIYFFKLWNYLFFHSTNDWKPLAANQSHIHATLFFLASASTLFCLTSIETCGLTSHWITSSIAYHISRLYYFKYRLSYLAAALFLY